MLYLIKSINLILWSTPVLFLFLGIHLFFTIRLKFIQKKTFLAIRLSVTPEKANRQQTDSKEGTHSEKKGLSSFGALTTMLAATLGTGNIVGISTAVFLGGPGAVFWCWITGILGMATTYAECYLSLHYRSYDSQGAASGGPMQVMEKGLHNRLLACIYSFLVILSSFFVGCTTQSNSMADSAHELFRLPSSATGILAALLVGFVLVGGFSSIEKLCTSFVPIMAIFYLGGCFLVLFFNRGAIFSGLELILSSAFSPRPLSGGVAGGLICASSKMAIHYGVTRGLFTNEAGLGTSAIGAAGSNAENTGRQALISMSATFWDTVFMCAVTGLVIVTNLINHPDSLNGISPGGLTQAAFCVIPYIGAPLLSLCLILFAFATLIGWSYFGQQAFLYLFPQKGLGCYQTAYLVMIFLGAVLSLDIVWELTDTINFFLAIPNLICLILLQKEIVPYS